MKARLRVGVIGAGCIGRVHAANLASRIPETELAWIADASLDAAQGAAAGLGAIRTADDYRRVLEDRSTEAVAICSSTDTHARLIEEAAAAGKHIFCEKPLDLEPDRIRLCLDAVRRAAVHLQVGFNRRFDPGFTRLRALIAEGAVGVPHIVRITSRDPKPAPREYRAVSGGLFLDMTIHDFDIARFLLGEEIEEVAAATSVLVDASFAELGDVDTAVTTLRFSGGALGAVDNSRKAVYGYDQRAEVFGSGGCVVLPNEAPAGPSIWDARGRRGQPLHDFFVTRYQESYLAEMRAFARAVRDDRAPLVTGLDGLKAVLISVAARQSARERRPVKVARA